jgi:hypothetical protein
LTCLPLDIALRHEYLTATPRSGNGAFGIEPWYSSVQKCIETPLWEGSTTTVVYTVV